ncbi:MAG: GIY-YIG nuclease family protein [Candidatus Omnitrophica bacterium]|nr:GIY-YIG nuclease family protein [Candidatus Omnitrophota bacterium]
MGYLVYVLKSRKNGSRYIGSTQDLANRLKEHNSGRNISTQNKGPWDVIYSETFPTRFLAERREKFFKSGRGKEVLKNLLGHY